MAAFMAATSPPAIADRAVGWTCKAYPSSDLAKAPPNIAAFFREYKSSSHDSLAFNSLVEYCRDKSGMTHSFILRGPVTREKGVCHYTGFNIRPLFSKKGNYLGEKHANTLRRANGDQLNIWDDAWYQMQLASQPCPPNTDKRYVYTARVPVGVFRDLLSAWNTWTSSEANLSAAMDLPKPADELSAKAPTSFRETMKRHHGQPVRVDEVILQEWPGKPAIFVIRVTNPENPDNGWYVSVDIQERRWKIVGVTGFVI